MSYFAKTKITALAFLVSASLLASTSHANNATITIEETNIPTQIIRGLHPLIPMFAGSVLVNKIGTPDGSIKSFAGLVIIAANFGAGSEVANAFPHLGITKGSLAQGAAAVALFIPASILNSRDSSLTTGVFSAATNQVGMAYRQMLSESTSDPHWIDTLKSTGSLVALATIGLSQSGHNVFDANGRATLVDRVGVSASFTAAYMLREALIDHLKHLPPGFATPTISTAALLSFVGTVATMVTDPHQMPAFLAWAIFEAGAYTGVDAAVGAAMSHLPSNYDVNMARHISKGALALIGGLLYVPFDAPNAHTQKSRVLRTVAGALMIPAAFETLSVAKEFLSHISWNE